MTKPQDKRNAKRVAAQRPARVKRVNDIVEELEGQTRDVSVRGIYLYLSRKVSEGAALEVVLPLPDGLTNAGELWVRCKCRIVRVEPGPQAKQFGVAAMIESFEPLADSATGHA